MAHYDGRHDLATSVMFLFALMYWTRLKTFEVDAPMKWFAKYKTSTSAKKRKVLSRRNEIGAKLNFV